MAAPQKKAKKQGKKSVITNLRRGRGVSVRFFQQNAWMILFLVVIVVMLISLRYRTKVNMMQITQLERELEQAENRKIEEKALYMSTIRETDMQQLIDRHNLGLQFQEQPPYILEISDK